MKKFYTALDVEYASSKRDTKIFINENDVITDVAKEAAKKHNIEFIVRTEESNEDYSHIKTDVIDEKIPKTNKSIIAPEYKKLISEQEIDNWRQEFPILQDAIHVANCSQSAQSNRVREAINRYLDNWLTVGMDWESWMEEVRFAKIEFAKLINAEPSEIAISTSVSEVVSSIASSLDFSGKRKR